MQFGLILNLRSAYSKWTSVSSKSNTRVYSYYSFIDGITYCFLVLSGLMLALLNLCNLDDEIGSLCFDLERLLALLDESNWAKNPPVLLPTLPSLLFEEILLILD
jgi:hypothetical protein